MSKFTEKVLLIEDDSSLSEIIVAYFRQKNIAVVAFENPITAIDSLKKDSSYQAIITDLNLPLISGLDFIKTIKDELQLDIPIILITVTNDVDTAIKAIDAGAYDFVVKPLHFPQLLISVQRAFKVSKLDEDNKTLKKVIGLSKGDSQSIIGKSQAFLKIIDLAKRIADSSATVYISGESGTGKEVFAKAIHNWSQRKNKPFVAINCSAIPENLLESEFFGHAKGAFTGAVDKKVGLFEEASGGTLFLDEIGDLNLSLQAKILRVIQERKIKRVGENTDVPIDIRLITATHKNLAEEVRAGKFREDLFFRLNVIPIKIPALRERSEDIIPLADFFLKKFNALNGKHIVGFESDVKKYLIDAKWPGNVRELENAIERAVVLTADSSLIDMSSFDMFNEQREPSKTETTLGANALPSALQDLLTAETVLPLDQIEKQYIKFVINKNKGAKDISAKMLGIDRKTLYRKIQEIEA